MNKQEKPRPRSAPRLNFIIGTVSGLLVAVPPAAIAADAGWYLGAGLGQSKLKTSLCAGVEDNVAAVISELAADGIAVSGVTLSCNADNKDTAWKLFGGYQFNPNFAFEGGYVGLGKYKGDASVSGSFSGGGISGTGSETDRLDVKVRGYNLSGVGIWPVTKTFSIFGKVGLFRWDVDTDYSARATAASVGLSDTLILSESLSATGTDLTYGLGVGFELTKNVYARAEWERFQDVGDTNTTGQDDIDLWSASIVFAFR